MFEIQSESFGEFTLLKILNVTTGESVSVIPECGATLNQVKLKGADGRLHSVLNENSSYAQLVHEGKKMYKGSKLFPFPNRIKNGCYEFNGQKYSLPINHALEGHSIHGLVYESKFDVIGREVSSGHASVILEYRFKGIEGYPFKFDLRIIYTLSQNKFSIKTQVKNCDTRELPAGDGWHPYFKINGVVDEIYLSLPSSEVAELKENKIPSGKFKKDTGFNDDFRIGSRCFDDCFKFSDGEGVKEVKLIDKKEKIVLTIWMESGIDKYRYVQLYIPPSRDSIAIEPMSCLPDAFNNKNGLTRIFPGEVHEWNWGGYIS